MNDVEPVVLWLFIGLLGWVVWSMTCETPGAEASKKETKPIVPRVRALPPDLERNSMDMKAVYDFCPNTENRYHWCSTYCAQRYGQGREVAPLNSGWMHHDFE